MKSFGIWILTFLVFLSSSVLHSGEPIIEQQLNGSLKLIASPKSDVNLASPFNAVVVQNVVIPFNIAKVAGRNQLRSTFQWAGKATRGQNVDWSLAGPGEAFADWNATPPKFTFDLPFILNTNGTRLPLRLRFTSQPGSDAFGPTQGSARKLSETSADLVLFASTAFFFNTKDLFPDGENRRVEYVGRVTFTGRLNAINGSKLF